ncbi:MAG: hypothetical protein Q4E62_06805, partial [Sutterellaceae bacterium]|nr:hypothetical protein [Sutterellaceae bacterium]
VSGTAPTVDTEVTVKTRYRAPDGACRIAGTTDTTIDLAFPVPQWAATPGQSAVLYAGEVCLGGGFIDTIDNCDLPEIQHPEVKKKKRRRAKKPDIISA